ncbi:S1C family serine protease [Variovorax sp.]|uniref:S1C family serine protease n=1 Tax=Variovorax sp. TaxID=1871043 RepID=UPI003BAAB68D
MRTRVLCLAALLAAGPAAALEPDVLFAKVSGSVWAIRTFDAQSRPLSAGSAVVIAPGRLVTNCHVLAKASSFVVRQENVAYGATLEYPDPQRDLCQVKVANFTAPPVALAPAGSARVGQRVYAIGNPRGLENTLSDGILSGLRGEEGERLLQTTAAIAPGSSGGGLFDSEGRLLGITTFAAKDGGSLNFAVPAEWLAELPARAKTALEARTSGADGNGRGAPAAGRPGAPRLGEVFEYVLIDGLTGTRTPVLYRVDRIDGENVSFNQGGRVEKADGRVVSIGAPIGGAFETASPPGGWGRPDLSAGMRWSADYVGPCSDRLRYQLDAAVLGTTELRVEGAPLAAWRIAYTGWMYVGVGSTAPAPHPFSATVFYSAELGRVVKFDAEYRRGAAGINREAVELVRIQR